MTDEEFRKSRSYFEEDLRFKCHWVRKFRGYVSLYVDGEFVHRKKFEGVPSRKEICEEFRKRASRTKKESYLLIQHE